MNALPKVCEDYIAIRNVTAMSLTIAMPCAHALGLSYSDSLVIANQSASSSRSSLLFSGGTWRRCGAFPRLRNHLPLDREGDGGPCRCVHWAGARHVPLHQTRRSSVWVSAPPWQLCSRSERPKVLLCLPLQTVFPLTGYSHTPPHSAGVPKFRKQRVLYKVAIQQL